MRDRIDLYDSAQDMIICELDKIVQKNEMTPHILESIDKLVDIIKDLDELMDNEEARTVEDYTQRSSGRYYSRGNSYRSGNYYRDGSSYKGNSIASNEKRHNDTSSSMLNHLYMALDTASSEDERRRIQKMIDEIEKK